MGAQTDGPGRLVRRAAVPTAAVAGIAALGAGIWPALASDGSPDLPEVTAEELLVQVAESDTARLSGTVRVEAETGIPDLGGMVDGMLGGLDGPAGALADLATGEGTMRVAVDGPERQRIAVGSGEDEFSVIHDGDRLWAYDSGSNTVYEAEVPEHAPEAGEHRRDGAHEELGGFTPREAAERLLDAAGEHAEISVDGTARVAGRDAYQLLVEPRDSSRLTAVRVAVDAETGVPLAVTADGPDGRLLDVAFSQISFAKPPGGQFEFTPPRDAEIIEINPDNPLEGLLDGLGGLGLEGLDDVEGLEDFHGLEDQDFEGLEGLEGLEDDLAGLVPDGVLNG